MRKRRTFVVAMAIRERRLAGPWDYRYASRRDVARINAERLAVIRQLRRLGYAVAVPKYAEAYDERLFSRLPEGVRVFNARAPIARTLEVGGEEVAEMHDSARWARDLWQKTPEGRVKRFSREGENPFGEGSKSIFLPNNVVIANRSLRKNETVGELRQKGFRFYFVRSAKIVERHPVMPKIKKTKVISHVDLYAGAVGRVLLVDRGFYLRNLLGIRSAARRAGLKILFVPKGERHLHPANFLVLEPNKVLVDKDAKETIALLRENGVEVIPTAISMRGNRNSGGGVHCLVNEL